MTFWIYLAIGLSFGLWCSKKTYTWCLEDSGEDSAAVQVAACFLGLVTILVCTLFWPIIFLGMGLRRFLWSRHSATS